MLRGTIYAYKPRTFFAGGETPCLCKPITSTKMPFGSDVIFDRMSIIGTIISITAICVLSMHAGGGTKARLPAPNTEASLPMHLLALPLSPNAI